MPANPFRNTVLRGQYDAALRAYAAKHRDLFAPDGSQRMGNSFGSFFWRGFNGTQFGAGFIDRASKETLAYAYWCAGRDAKKAEQ